MSEDEYDAIRMKKMNEMKSRNEEKAPAPPSKPIKVDDSTMDQLVLDHELVLVDCWAPWCGPCQILGPTIDSLAERMQGQVVFAKLNVDENRETSMRYQVMSIPTMLVFKNGQHVDTLMGAHPEGNIVQMLKKHM